MGNSTERKIPAPELMDKEYITKYLQKNESNFSFFEIENAKCFLLKKKFKILKIIGTGEFGLVMLA